MTAIRPRAPDRPNWLLQTDHTAMLLSLGANDALRIDYWGPSQDPWQLGDCVLPSPPDRAPAGHFLDGQPLAYPTYGDATFKEPCLCVVYHDGTRIVQLVFQQARETVVDGRRMLEIEFVDPVYHLTVTHRLVTYPEHDVIARSVRLLNAGNWPVTVERAFSAALALPPGRYDAWTLHGQWGREFQLHRRALGPGKFVVDSRRGRTSHEANPWFALTPAGAPGAAPGLAWFGALAWSGNWSVTFEVEPNDAVSVVAGIAPFDFSWRLDPGETFETPELIGGCTEEGIDGARRLLHAFQRQVILPAPHRETLRPVLYNSWYATKFDVRVNEQIELARLAADLGAELFVVDDGWFGERNSDRAGLGDWRVNPTKFPRGLGELIDAVQNLGMRFGIWVEPEMVNEASDLYRAHPDWIFNFPSREPTRSRNQLVLNFARPDVRENIHGQLRRLLQANQIDFVKWDHNRPLTEVGWPSAPIERQREVWTRHVRGVYEVLAALRAEFPHVLFESCASGGGRVDLGILRWTDQVWVSDNTDAQDRLAMQYGYSQAYAPLTMVNWVTDVPDGLTGRVIPLEFRFHVAMQGVLGLGGNLLQWNSEHLAQARELVAIYKRVRPLIQQGTQYWLVPPTSDGVCAVQYVADGGAATALFVYQLHGRVGQGLSRVRLRGLNPIWRYRRDGDGVESSGAALMASGVPVFARGDDGGRHRGDWQSAVQHWVAIA